MSDYLKYKNMIRMCPKIHYTFINMLMYIYMCISLSAAQEITIKFYHTFMRASKPLLHVQCAHGEGGWKGGHKVLSMQNEKSDYWYSLKD